MELAIQNCPACSAVVMEGSDQCPECGKELPKPDVNPQPVARTMISPEEQACPKCGSPTPRGVLRCRDCGSYMSADVEAAALAKQASRGFASLPAMAGFMGRVSYGTPGVSNSSFSEVASDDDFDLNAGVGMSDDAMQDFEGRTGVGEAYPVGAGGEDDFEMGEGGTATAAPEAPPSPVSTGTDDYAVTSGGLPTFEEEKQPTASAAAPAGEARRTDAPPVPKVDHSVETAGDVLLDAAIAEEKDSAKRQKYGRRRRRVVAASTTGDRFMVFCPNGHRIQVQDKHRGRTGRCPNCKSPFFVPLAQVSAVQGEAGAAGAPGADAAAAAAPAQTAYSTWITDLRLHRVNPGKLKLKPGSLEAEHEAVDVSASPEHVLIAVLFAGGGPFRAMQEPKKKAATREAMLEHLKGGKPLSELPVPKQHTLSPDQLQVLKIVQPTVPGEESLFADVPVFGEGRIAIRVPAADTPNERAYLSFTLSQFRGFAQLLADTFSLTGFGAATSIPMTDEFTEAKCHYSDNTLKALLPDRLLYYKSDPAMKLMVLGRKCQKCGLVVSEDSRKKEKIGGKTDASVAKAQCPKCKQKFGDITLYGFPE